MGGLVADWQQMIMVVAVLSLAVGNIVAIAQSNLKRMLAYSTISHVGFILLGILAGNNEGYSTAMFYTITYAVMSLGGFGVIMLMARQGFEADNITDLAGLNQRSPWFAFIMMVLMLSMAGVLSQSLPAQPRAPAVCWSEVSQRMLGRATASGDCAPASVSHQCLVYP